MKPIAVNFHINKSCNTHCRFCFATFRAVRGQSRTAQSLAVIDALADAGCQKLNIAGGEPTLRKDLGQLLRHAKSRGLTTSLITNGFALDKLLDDHAEALDWVGLSVDSGLESVQHQLGRGDGTHVANSIRLATRCRDLGLRVKLNSVVTALTCDEDMSALVRTIQPERWKAFQVLPIAGQNDGSVKGLLISADQFQAFVDRHAHLATEGLAPVVEDNNAMRGSYVMVGPLGRFFGNATGRHVYSQPILDVGVDAALAQVGFVPTKFEARGGKYAW
jgi:radical S-adenosyl methionine domain-containing protein 2